MKTRFILFSFLISILLLIGCSIEDFESTGTVRFSNNSSNPYILYINGQSKGEYSGGSWRNVDLEEGTYTLKAEQVSGFLLFPTVKNGQIKVDAGDYLEWAFP